MEDELEGMSEPSTAGPVGPTYPGIADPPALPLSPPPARESAKRRRRSVLIWGAVLLAVLLCGASSVAMSSFLTDGMSSGWLDPGTRSAAWCGDGRYAVVEYQGSGKDATRSVIAWDSRTGKTVKVDGYRLVATEPSSTQVWLTPARTPSEEDIEYGTDEVVVSPWDEDWYGGEAWDGPGTAFSWDAAAGGEPRPWTSPKWRPWPNGRGVSAKLDVWPSLGLYPSSIEFVDETGESVSVDLPGEWTFRPIGWSPSGRFFAIDGLDDEGPTIIDSKTGEIAAEYEEPMSDDTDYWYETGAMPAWDPVEDKLWIPLMRNSDSEDAVDFEVGLQTLRPYGPQLAFLLPPADWRHTEGTIQILGSTADSLIVDVPSFDGARLWSVSEGVARELERPKLPEYCEMFELAYSRQAGYLVSEQPGEFSLESHGPVAVFSDKGARRQVWPLPEKE